MIGSLIALDQFNEVTSMQPQKGSNPGQKKPDVKKDQQDVRKTNKPEQKNPKNKK